MKVKKEKDSQGSLIWALNKKKKNEKIHFNIGHLSEKKKNKI